MSFSSQVKDELADRYGNARHCMLAEIAALISFCGRVIKDENGCLNLKFQTENEAVARKYFTLLKKSFNINSDVSVRRNVALKKSQMYLVNLVEQAAVTKVLSAVKLMDMDYHLTKELLASNLIVKDVCCKRAFIRGAFLAVGSISDPNKTYHFELACLSQNKALQLQKVMAAFDIDAKIIMRKKYHIVYVKEGTQIVDLLNIMEAHLALMELENIRIVKEVRNSINRRVNCETANINKTVSAAVKQVEDIQYIKRTVGLGKLSEGLREIADLRLENPEASLIELGKMLSNPVGKSGVNHRLRKLSAIADDLRQQET